MLRRAQIAASRVADDRVIHLTRNGQEPRARSSIAAGALVGLSALMVLTGCAIIPKGDRPQALRRRALP